MNEELRKIKKGTEIGVGVLTWTNIFAGSPFLILGLIGLIAYLIKKVANKHFLRN